jgi:hypothetical protein
MWDISYFKVQTKKSQQGLSIPYEICRIFKIQFESESKNFVKLIALFFSQ